MTASPVKSHGPAQQWLERCCVKLNMERTSRTVSDRGPSVTTGAGFLVVEDSGGGTGSLGSSLAGGGSRGGDGGSPAPGSSGPGAGGAPSTSSLVSSPLSESPSLRLVSSSSTGGGGGAGTCRRLRNLATRWPSSSTLSSSPTVHGSGSFTFSIRDLMCVRRRISRRFCCLLSGVMALLLTSTWDRSIELRSIKRGV